MRGYEKMKFKSISKSRTQKSDGFTLLETSIGLLLIGLVVSGLLNGYNIWVKSKGATENEEIQVKVVRALYQHMTEFGRLPCPANPALSPGDAGYGFEEITAGGNCIVANIIYPRDPVDPWFVYGLGTKARRIRSWTPYWKNPTTLVIPMHNDGHRTRF